MGFNLNNRKFRDAIKLRNDWEIADTPAVCFWGDSFNMDHAMICKLSGFIIHRHNELRDLEAEMLNIVCHDIQVELVLQDLTGEVLPKGANKAPDTMHVLTFMPVVSGRGRVLHSLMFLFLTPMQTHKDLSPQQIYHQHENDKKRMYTRRVMEVEQVPLPY